MQVLSLQSSVLCELFADLKSGSGGEETAGCNPTADGKVRGWEGS